MTSWFSRSSALDCPGPVFLSKGPVLLLRYFSGHKSQLLKNKTCLIPCRVGSYIIRSAHQSAVIVSKRLIETHLRSPKCSFSCLGRLFVFYFFRFKGCQKTGRRLTLFTCLCFWPLKWQSTQAPPYLQAS